MVSTNDLKNGMAVIIEGEIYEVLWFQHVKPGKGGAFVRTRVRNLKTDSVIEKTFRAGEDLEQAYIESKSMQYLYKDEDTFWFMDTDTYEQYPINERTIRDGVKFLKEESIIKVKFYEGRIVGIELPTFVELKVVETVPGVKGDTVSGGSKPATVETGAVVQVPLFIKEGDIIKVDTRTGEYVARV